MNLPGTTRNMKDAAVGTLSFSSAPNTAGVFVPEDVRRVLTEEETELCVLSTDCARTMMSISSFPRLNTSVSLASSCITPSSVRFPNVRALQSNLLEAPRRVLSKKVRALRPWATASADFGAPELAFLRLSMCDVCRRDLRCGSTFGR